MKCGRIALAAVASLALAGVALAQTVESAGGAAPAAPVDNPPAAVSTSKPAPAGQETASPAAQGAAPEAAAASAPSDTAGTLERQATETERPQVRRRASTRRSTRSSDTRRSTRTRADEKAARPTPTVPSPASSTSPAATSASSSPVAKPATRPAAPANAHPFLTDYQDPAKDREMPLGRVILDLFVKLVVVCGIAYGSIYALRGIMARQGVMPGRRGHLRVIESASLGPNRSIHLVRVGGKVMVVGSTPEQVSALGEIEDEETLELLAAESQATSFSASLTGALSREASSAPEDGAPLATQVRGSVRHLWDQVQEIRGLRGKGNGR